MKSVEVLAVMEKAFQNIDMLEGMQMIPEWERQTRIRANREHANSVFRKWMRERHGVSDETVCVHV
jgi:hypothetical protein